MDIPPVVSPPRSELPTIYQVLPDWQAEALERLLAMPKGQRFVVVMPQQTGKRALAAALSARQGA